MLSWAATPTPEPTVDPELVTPGPLGFAIVAVLVIAVALLVFDMLRRVRRARYREEVNEQLDAEEAAAEQATAGPNDERPDAERAADDDGAPGPRG